jgi:hypothetical protein
MTRSQLRISFSGNPFGCGIPLVVWRKNELEVLVQRIARRDAVALIRRYVKAGVFHA